MKKRLLLWVVAVVVGTLFSIPVFAMLPPYQGPVYKPYVNVFGHPEGIEVRAKTDYPEGLQISNDTAQTLELYENGLLMYRIDGPDGIMRRSSGARLRTLGADGRMDDGVSFDLDGSISSVDFLIKDDGMVVLKTYGRRTLFEVNPKDGSVSMTNPASDELDALDAKDHQQGLFGCFAAIGLDHETQEIYFADEDCNRTPGKTTIGVLNASTYAFMRELQAPSGLDSSGGAETIRVGKDGVYLLSGFGTIWWSPQGDSMGQSWKEVEGIGRYPRELTRDDQGRIHVLVRDELEYHQENYGPKVPAHISRLEGGRAIESFEIQDDPFIGPVATQDGQTFLYGVGNGPAYRLWRLERSGAKREVPVEDPFLLYGFDTHDGMIVALDGDRLFRPVQTVQIPREAVKRKGPFSFSAKLGEKRFTISGGYRLDGYATGRGYVPLAYAQTVLAIIIYILAAVIAHAAVRVRKGQARTIAIIAFVVLTLTAYYYLQLESIMKRVLPLHLRSIFHGYLDPKWVAAAFLVMLAIFAIARRRGIRLPIFKSRTTNRQASGDGKVSTGIKSPIQK